LFEKASAYAELVNMPTSDFDSDYRSASGTSGLPRPLYWVIKSGKQKDAPDISNVKLRKVSPCLTGVVTATSDNIANFSKCLFCFVGLLLFV
jgi:hypothetical protein